MSRDNQTLYHLRKTFNSAVNKIGNFENLLAKNKLSVRKIR